MNARSKGIVVTAAGLALALPIVGARAQPGSAGSGSAAQQAPAAPPIVAEEEPKPGPGGAMSPEGPSPAASTPAGPGADEFLEKYAQALGGADALQKVSSRVEKGTMTGFGGRRVPIEVLSKA